MFLQSKGKCYLTPNGQEISNSYEGERQSKLPTMGLIVHKKQIYRRIVINQYLISFFFNQMADL